MKKYSAKRDVINIVSILLVPWVLIFFLWLAGIYKFSTILNMFNIN